MQDVLKIISPVYICIVVDSPDCSSELTTVINIFLKAQHVHAIHTYILIARHCHQNHSVVDLILLIASNVYGIYTPFTIYIVDSPVC